LPLRSEPGPAPESERLELSAPAKVNLGLRVLARRADGYHFLESLFVPVDLVDDVALEVERGHPSDGARVTVEVSIADDGAVVEADAVPTDGRNLAVVAARAFLARLADLQRLAETRPARGVAEICEVRIRLHKRIPAAAGLGGGSSDAGAVLRGLSRLVPEGPAGEELVRVAAEVGADVPFFLDPVPSLVTGIGDRLEPAAKLPPLFLLLVNPGLPISTAEVFALYDAMLAAGESPPAALTTSEPGSTMRALSRLDSKGNAPSQLQACVNDLEAAAIRLCPSVARLRDRLRALGATGVGMSGSGATLYGLFPSDVESRRALEEASFEPPIWARVVRSLTQVSE
jgi:4-diphosphocytidyl-2-C-methyl-D-erythritol kinase